MLLSLLYSRIICPQCSPGPACPRLPPSVPPFSARSWKEWSALVSAPSFSHDTLVPSGHSCPLLSCFVVESKGCFSIWNTHRVSHFVQCVHRLQCVSSFAVCPMVCRVPHGGPATGSSRILLLFLLCAPSSPLCQASFAFSPTCRLSLEVPVLHVVKRFASTWLNVCIGPMAPERIGFCTYYLVLWLLVRHALPSKKLRPMCCPLPPCWPRAGWGLLWCGDVCGMGTTSGASRQCSLQWGSRLQSLLRDFNHGHGDVLGRAQSCVKNTDIFCFCIIKI